MIIPDLDICRFQEKLVTWYQAHHRQLPWRESNDPYRIWISEVMLQQTQVKTVISYFYKFIHHFPTLDELAQADLERVLKMWEGLGYYARARNFHKAAKRISKDLNGIIPDDFSQFKTLPGVGDYIGAAVQSIAFGHPFAVVDGNVKRVLARLYCLRHPVNKSSSHQYFKGHADLLLEKKDPGTFNQAMMELGALICTPRKPQCTVCPVSQFCKAFLSDRMDEYPRRVKAKKVPTYHIAAGIVRKKGQMLITRRKLDGLLGGLWEFPGGKLKTGEDAASACIREIQEETGICVQTDAHLTTVHHAYTHFKIQMDIYYCTYVSGSVHLNGPIDFRWIRLKELDTFAFPKANLKFIPMIEENLSHSV